MIRPIQLGCPPISAAIVNEENRRRFRPVHSDQSDSGWPHLPHSSSADRSTAAAVIPPSPPSEEQFDSLGGEPGLDQHLSRVNAAHALFLHNRNSGLRQLGEMIRWQMAVQANRVPDLDATGFDVEERQEPAPQSAPIAAKPAGVIFDEADLLEFAGGRIANVFGPEYAVIDTYPYRVRLPLPPYLLVNRVIDLNAVRGEFKPSSLTTEYDIPHHAWYSVDKQIPWAIASEAGQCDLLLISYLGIDFITQGQRYYRLTDYTMTFMDELPKEGDTLRYHIRIDSFMKSGEAIFFNFRYDCFVGDKLVYQMTGGRAGFSTEEELAQGKGIILSRVEMDNRQNAPRRSFTPLLSCGKTRFEREDLLHITRGDLAACLGPTYDPGGDNPSLRFAAEKIMMLDRIVSIDCKGGAWGLGEVVAEKDLAPDHWYFPCHFKDDNVLAGTLITEGCVQLLEFYMLYLGLQIKTQDARFQPIRNRPYVIRARGQIVPSDTRYQYRMEVFDIGLTPRPFARANFFIILEGKTIVDFRDLGIELVEKAEGDPARRVPSSKSEVSAPMFTHREITEFAVGSLSRCFGPDFDIYENRRAPRTPNGDLQLISRVLSVDGQRMRFDQQPTLISEYDVPVDAWFLTENAYPYPPYSMLMEIALQPCGFLSAYMGATLIYPEVDLCFRNLSSDAQLIENVDLAGGTVTAFARLLSVSKAAETIVLDFDYELKLAGRTFYQGRTQFGYFTPLALSRQKGLDRGEKTAPWFERNDIRLHQAEHFDLSSPPVRDRYYHPKPECPHYRMSGPMLDFLDDVWIFGEGGEYGRGYIYASKRVDPTDWFYPCHFYQDPVMPGSLGVESILQAIRLFALRHDLGGSFRSPRFNNVPGRTGWLYRGQIIPEDEWMEIEVHIKEIVKHKDQVIVLGDANLWKDRLRIYHITDAAVSLMESA